MLKKSTVRSPDINILNFVIPFAVFMALAKPAWIRSGLVVLGLMLAANAIFGNYHSGVMCDEPAIRILGLSLAGWNAIICAALATLAFRFKRNPS